MNTRKTVIEICAGGGGAALGFERAGFRHVALIDYDESACKTLLCNRPDWNVICADLKNVAGDQFSTVDLLAGGLPSDPFSVAGRQLGPDDDRNLFPVSLDFIRKNRPRAIMLDTVSGFLHQSFAIYRQRFLSELEALGYTAEFRSINTSDFGVCQSRRLVLLVAISGSRRFAWPDPVINSPKSVGSVIYDLMASKGWKGVDTWRDRAHELAPAIIGGSGKHGGPDLGPTRTKQSWLKLGVNPLSLADGPPEEDFEGDPKLTLPMVARLQGFPPDWTFVGTKTMRYKQIAQALPPPVSERMGIAIACALNASSGL